MRILVLSDTHLPLRSQSLPGGVLRALESSPDLILHGGDLVGAEVICLLEQYGPVHAVTGNMDPLPIKQKVPRVREIDLGPISVGMIHGDELGDSVEAIEADLVGRFPEVDVVVFGHIHRPRLNLVDGIWMFNPGSSTDPRGGSPPSFGWIEVEHNHCRLSIECLG